MITSIKKILLLGLLYAFIIGASLHGAETQTPSPLNEGNPANRTARIIAVDTTKRTLNLQIKGTRYLLFLNPHVINTRTHQQIALDQLATGQFITFVSRPRPNGQLEIVSLIILHDESENPPGGRTGGGPITVSPSRSEVSPFQ